MLETDQVGVVVLLLPANEAFFAFPVDDAGLFTGLTLRGVAAGHEETDENHREDEKPSFPHDRASYSRRARSSRSAEVLRQRCNGSWWQWDGDPSWLIAQVDALAAKHSIDRSRMYLAGWSGGATYIGMRTQAFERTFAGLVIHGGGHRPQTNECGAKKTPVAFLWGTGNPLHDLGERLRDHYEGCGAEIRTTLLPKADHAAELRALDDHGDAIMEWLVNRRKA